MNSQINIKAHYNGNIRRFQSQALWTVLSKDLQALFSFDPNMRVKILYRDDENDLCQLSSQMELEFAASQYSPLQIFIQPDQAVNSEVVVEVQSSPVLPLQPLTRPLSQSAPVRCDRLTARLACVEKKLESPTLPAHRREKLMAKKSKLEEVIRSRSPVEAPAQVQQAPLVAAPEQPKRCGRRNPSERLAQIDRALSQPNLPPKRLERLQQQKSKLEDRFQSSEESPAPVVSSPVPEVVVLRGPAARLLAIEKILAQPDLPPRRAEKLMQKKARIEQFLRQRAEKESSASQQVISAPSPCRGPEARMAAITKMLESNDLPPHRIQKLMEQKARIDQRLKERTNAVSENRCRGRRRDQDGCSEKPRARLVVVRRK